MDKALKQRLVGASVLIILAVIVLPMLLSGRSDTLNTESRQIELPDKPDELSIETRRFPVGIPDKPIAGTPTQADEQPAVELQPQAADSVEVNPISDNETDIDSVIAVGSGQTSTEVSAAAELVIAPPEVTTVILQPAENTSTIKPEYTAGTSGQPRYLVQVASFSSENRANAMAAELRAEKMSVMMDVVDRTAGRLHRVRVGPYVEHSDAEAVVTRIRAMNKDLSPRILDTRPDDGAPVSAPSDPLVRWVVQVGSYNSASTAESEVARLRLAGLTAYSEKVSSANDTLFKVRIGPEINRENAVQLLKDLEAKHDISGFVTTQE